VALGKITNGNGDQVRAISFAMHLKIVGAICTLSTSIICGMAMRLYDLRTIPVEVAREFREYVEQEKATAAQTHQRLQEKGEDNARRITSLEEWRGRLAERIR